MAIVRLATTRRNWQKLQYVNWIDGLAGLRARHAAKRDTAASTLIQTIVTICTRWIRRIASGEAICNTEAIHSIMALHFRLSR